MQLKIRARHSSQDWTSIRLSMTRGVESSMKVFSEDFRRSQYYSTMGRTTATSGPSMWGIGYFKMRFIQVED
ncbi:Hypothetical protein SMAX5B_020959 [Scophthalmus maximus]|uniref:Uncharacterized protein n=1 Tax=Scophthalmus maximus TaxID=52904 RepID=A0A2U9CQM5_SCOMX|nr:Hypothetical protein SMAX5B_020959 [Scophthalmus maximus]